MVVEVVTGGKLVVTDVDVGGGVVIVGDALVVARSLRATVVLVATGFVVDGVVPTSRAANATRSLLLRASAS